MQASNTVTSKPKERATRVNYREADKDMHVNTYLDGFLGAKKWAGQNKERNEAGYSQGHDIQVRTAWTTRSCDGGIPRQRTGKEGRNQAMRLVVSSREA